MRPSHIGNHRGDSAASNGFFGGPEQFVHGGGTHQHQRIGVEAETEHARAIRHAHFLGFADQLQIDNRWPLATDEAARLAQGKAQRSTGMAAFVGENLLQQAAGRNGKAPMLRLNPCPRLGQGWPALDLGNGIAQRGKALVTVGGAHRATS